MINDEIKKVVLDNFNTSDTITCKCYILDDGTIVNCEHDKNLRSSDHSTIERILFRNNLSMFNSEEEVQYASLRCEGSPTLELNGAVRVCYFGWTLDGNATKSICISNPLTKEQEDKLFTFFLTSDSFEVALRKDVKDVFDGRQVLRYTSNDNVDEVFKDISKFYQKC